MFKFRRKRLRFGWLGVVVLAVNCGFCSNFCGYDQVFANIVSDSGQKIQAKLANSYSDEDFIYIRGGFSSSAADYCVLSKSLMNKFYPNFLGHNCQLVFENSKGERLYSYFDGSFCVDEANDIYVAGLGFSKDSRSKTHEPDGEFWNKMGGKICKVGLFENNKLVRNFKVKLYKNKQDKNEQMTKKVAHLTKKEIEKFNDITRKKRKKWVDSQKKLRNKAKNDFANEIMPLKKGSSSLYKRKRRRQIHLEDLDFSAGTRNWFAKGSQLAGSLSGFLMHALIYFHKYCKNSKNSPPLVLWFSDLKNNDFFKQKAFIYFSPTWFIEKLKLNVNEYFKKYMVEVESSNGDVFRSKFENVFGPFLDGDFCLADVSVCKQKLDERLKTHAGSNKFKFENGKTYKVRFYKNGKIVPTNLVCEFEAKAEKRELDKLYIGEFSDSDHAFTMGNRFFYKHQETKSASGFKHPAEFNMKYYKNLLTQSGSNEISWNGKLVYGE